MKLFQIRSYGPLSTLGRVLVLDGVTPRYSCYSIELPDLGNQPNISCIPEGEYDCTKYLHPTRGKTFIVLNVPGRAEIMWHIGNYAAGKKKIDTEGCTLPGQYFQDLNADGNIDIAGSTATMNKLYDLMPDKFKLKIIS